jgi:hypothetical protein
MLPLSALQRWVPRVPSWLFSLLATRLPAITLDDLQTSRRCTLLFTPYSCLLVHVRVPQG